jgi:hypothetical protein
MGAAGSLQRLRGEEGPRVIKATAMLPDGRRLLMIGLSIDNLDKLRAAPLETMIRIDGREMGLGIDVLVFSGRTEGELGHALTKLTGPGSTVHIDPKLKT